jgi:hypothetical protein
MGNIFGKDEPKKEEKKAAATEAPATNVQNVKKEEGGAAKTADSSTAPPAEDSAKAEQSAKEEKDDAAATAVIVKEDSDSTVAVEVKKDEMPAGALMQTMLEQEAKTKAEAAQKSGKVPSTKQQVGRQKKKDKKSKFGFKNTMGNRKN